MDIGMQISFSETFNIVSADLISEGVPVLSSNELPWIAKSAICEPTNSKDIVKKLLILHNYPQYNVKSNQESLINYVIKTKSIWQKYFLGDDDVANISLCCI
jgi:hypothetical protein